MGHRSVEDWARERNETSSKKADFKIGEKIGEFFGWVFTITVLIPIAILIICLIIFAAYHGLSLLWRFTIDVVVYTVEMFGFDFDYKPHFDYEPLVGE